MGEEVNRTEHSEMESAQLLPVEHIYKDEQGNVCASPQALAVEHIYEDEQGNVCAVILDSSDVTYMPMVPVEATEEVVMYDGIQQEVKIEVDEGYTVVYPEVYTEQNITPVQNKPQRKTARRGQHKCKVCNKTFSQTVNLITHERIHTGEKPFVCNMCLKPFSQQPNLWKHMRTHTGERPYQCVTCKKRFTQQANLAKHIRIHTGERPYCCDYCGKRFTQQANLTKHVRLHTGERPFQCRYCEKTFVQQSNLERHERIHTGVKPYKCQICCDSFAQNAHLSKHMRTVHKAVPGNTVNTYYVKVNCQKDKVDAISGVTDVTDDCVIEEQCLPYVKVNCQNDKVNIDTVSGITSVTDDCVIEEQFIPDSPKKIGIPVLYCTKTGRIIKRVD